MPQNVSYEALNDQVANEFAASHQYVAIGGSLRGADPAAAGALLLRAGGRGARPRDDDDQVPARHRTRPCACGRSPRPSTDFADHIARSGRRSSRSSGSAADRRAVRVAREEGDYLSEQFVQWFLKEQVEEEATMSELLDVAERVRDFPMTLEEFIAREQPGGGEGADPMAPGGRRGAA